MKVKCIIIDDEPLAIKVIQNIFPDREIIGIDCNTLISQGGAIHCASMQVY